MSAKEALQVLKNVLVTRVGLDTESIRLVLQAWAVLEQTIRQSEAETPPKQPMEG